MSVDERVGEGLSTSPERREIRQPGLGPVGWARWAWRLLTSMRTALVLLFLLALAAVPGSLLPQRPVSPSKVAAYFSDHPGRAPLLDKLGFFNVYSSPWFSAIYLLLFVSLVGCVLPRARLHAKALRARPPAAPRVLERLPEHRSFAVEADQATVVDAAREVLRGRRYRVDVHEAGRTGGPSVAAERGHLRETGNLVFHLSLVLVLVGVAAGHLWGFRANIVVPEGSGWSNVPAAYDDVRSGPEKDLSKLAPFSVDLSKLTVKYQEGGQQSGAPREFSAAVTYRPEPGAPERTGTVASNHPLVVDGTKVFLTGNGYAPRFTVRDGTGKVVLSQAVPFLPRDGNMTSAGVVKVPDAQPTQLGLQGLFLPTAFVDPAVGPISIFPDTKQPRVFFTVYQGDLGLDSGRPQSVYALDTAKMTQLKDPANPKQPLKAALAPGQTLTLPDGLGSITFDGISRFANFQVASDPGTTPSFVGVVLALLGLVLSLFVRRRRVWVRASAGEDGRTVVEVAGLSRTDEEGLGSEIDTLRDALAERLGVAPAQVQQTALSRSGAGHSEEEHA
ncbi:MAG TPA: cytochrome c biogenesis protein ResB [Motilibacteraceae bacterium]|nr:cytochrome c biogenesis protein ResB [Motilibacteraceae bacterium]